MYDVSVRCNTYINIRILFMNSFNVVACNRMENCDSKLSPVRNVQTGMNIIEAWEFISDIMYKQRFRKLR